MAITVKKLIAELEKIENKYLEVECRVIDARYTLSEITRVEKQDKKVVITTKDYSND